MSERNVTLSKKETAMKIRTVSFARKLALMAALALAPLANAQNAGEILGAGATFPFPLYSKMFSEYNKKTNIQVNYQSIGSGGGVKQIAARTVDFGASDAFLSNGEIEKMVAPVVHVPIVLGSVVATYNLPGVPTLRLTPAVLVDIFMGKITKWNDPALVAINPGVKLPAMGIIVVRRSDGSGTTSIFTDYLAKVSDTWRVRVGSGKSVEWPVGLGAKGNEGVSGLVLKMPGSIGYSELAYTKQNKMSVAAIQNSKGNFIMPSEESTTLSAQGTLPEDTRISLTNGDADQGYPISGFTWILVYQEQKYATRTEAQAKQLAQLLWWMIHDGQAYANPLNYAVLPDGAKVKAEKILKSLTYGGKPLL